MQRLKFEWDPTKARANAAKHGVTFEEAPEAFEDPLALVQLDAVHSGRELLLGTTRRARLLLVVYVERESDEILRVVSARKATPHERKAYEESR